MNDKLLEAIERFALSIAEQDEPKVRMPAQTWSKFRRILKIANIPDPTEIKLDQIDVDTEDRSFYDEC